MKKFDVIHVSELSNFKRWRFPQLSDLAVDEVLVIPFSEIGHNTPIDNVRRVVYYHGKKLGRRFETRKRSGNLLVIRVA